MWSLVALGAATSGAADLLSSPSALLALTASLAGLLALVLVHRDHERARRLTARTSTAIRVRPGATPHGLVPVPQTPPNAPGRPRPRAPSAR